MIEILQRPYSECCCVNRDNFLDAQKEKNEEASKFAFVGKVFRKIWGFPDDKIIEENEIGCSLVIIELKGISCTLTGVSKKV